MNETGLKAAVKRLLPKSIHVQSMTSASLSYGGTPDWYVDGATRDMWLEFKMLKSMPRSGIVVGNFTPLQIKWLDRRYKAGQNAHVVIGLPNRTAVTLAGEACNLSLGTPVEAAVPLKEVAAWIVRFCGA